MTRRPLSFLIAVIGTVCLATARDASAEASDHARSAAPRRLLPVQGAPLPEGTAEIRFADFFARPIGPCGLEPSARLLALQGKPVRIVGYMAAAGLPMAGRIVLAPMPVELGDEDEHLADDLPPQAVFVHLSGPAAARTLPNYAGVLMLTGTLDVGPREEPDGHVSTVRLLLDAAASAACLPEPSLHP